MPFDVEAARKQNIPDDAIANRIIETRHLDGAKMRAQGLTDQQIIEHYSKLDPAPEATKPETPDETKIGPAPSKFKEAATNVLHVLKSGQKAAAETGIQLGTAAVTAPVVAGATALGGPVAGAATEMAAQTAAYDTFQIANNILSGDAWNKDLGKSTLESAGGLAFGGLVGKLVKVASRSFINPEVAFTKVYGALKDAAKGKFDQMKKLPFFSDKEKADIIAKAGNLTPLGKKALDKQLAETVTYKELVNRNALASGHIEAAEILGETVKPTNLLSALDTAQEKLRNLPTQEGSGEVYQAIADMKQTIEDDGGILKPGRVKGFQDTLNDMMNKTKTKPGDPTKPKFQVFSGVDRALNQDIEQSDAKTLRLGSKLYAREKSLDNIFTEGFESGKLATVTHKEAKEGIINFNGEAFKKSIQADKNLDPAEKENLLKFGSRVKGFELPTEGEFASIKTAEAALSRHLAMKLALGGAVGAGAGALSGAGHQGKEEAAMLGTAGAIIGLLAVKGASRNAMTGSIIKTAMGIDSAKASSLGISGKQLIERELKSNNGVISKTVVLAAANLVIEYYKRRGDEQKAEIKKMKRQASQDIIDQTKQEYPELQQPGFSLTAPQTMQGMIGQQ